MAAVCEPAGIMVADERGLALPLEAALRMGPIRWGPTAKGNAGNE